MVGVDETLPGKYCRMDKGLFNGCRVFGPALGKNFKYRNKPNVG